MASRAAVGLFHLGLHRAPLEIIEDGEPGAAEALSLGEGPLLRGVAKGHEERIRPCRLGESVACRLEREEETLEACRPTDGRDRLWFVETGPSPNRFVGFDPEMESFFSVTDIGSGGGAVRHMVFHAPTRSIWFGTDANTVGRAKVP